jgi:hypothetical protein
VNAQEAATYDELRQALLRHGGHTRQCRTRLNGTGGNYGFYDEPCDCGWTELLLREVSRDSY